MKRSLLLVFAFLFILSLPSCYLFKPVQKTCPAYSSIHSPSIAVDQLSCELNQNLNENNF